MDDLRGLNTMPPEPDSGSAKLIAGALMVTLAVGAGVVYTFSSGSWSQPAPRIVALREPLAIKAPAPAAQISPPALVPAAPVVTTAPTTAPTRTARIRVHKRDETPPAVPDNSLSTPAEPAAAPQSTDSTSPGPAPTPVPDPATTPTAPVQPGP
jgi:hypothetical protein